MRPPASSALPVIVTAADEAYAGCLSQLLRNLERRRLAGVHRTVVADLGMTARRRGRLEKRFPWAEFRTFDFAAHPPHVGLGSRTYAWKPIFLAGLAEETGASVLWLDSATQVQGSLDEVKATLAATGLYVLRGQAALRERCDSEVSRALGASPALLDQREFVAGVVGADVRIGAVRELLRAWRRCALDPALMRPRHPGHMPEQAVLSLFVLQAIEAGQLSVPAVDVDISSPAPARWVSTRHKVPAWLPGWAGLPLQLGYRANKMVDQWIHRCRRYKATRVNGLHRWPKENFQVYVGAAGSGEYVPVPAPPWSYYADPFLWRDGGRVWLLVEQFLYLEHTARLVALPLEGNSVSGPPQPLELRGGRDTHRSFPFVFTERGQVYLVPETSAMRAVDLYVCEQFPGRWRWQRRLLDGVDAADTALLAHAGRWWMFTSVRPHGSAPRALEIYHTADLLDGRWEPHPVNGERWYAGAPFSSGRCAGPFARAADGAWLRPVQDSRHYYGEGVRFMRIDVLTTTAFQESEYTGEHGLGTLAAQVSPHHIAQAGELVAFDVRTRVSYSQHLPLPGRYALRPDPRVARLTAASGP
jgi:hypothetical protein